MTLGDGENAKEEDGCTRWNNGGKQREMGGCCWAHAANVASLIWVAHCAKLHKPYSGPWTYHLKVGVLGQQPGPHEPP